MEITTIGRGKGSFVADEVQISLLFQNRSNNYETVLKEGNESINDFVNQVLLPLGFSKEDLETKNLIVKEERQYNHQTRVNELIGYLFESEALLKFPYDKDLIALFLNAVSRLNMPPQFTLNFGLINEEKYHDELLDKAYQDALRQAKVIIESSKKEVKDTLKVSFEPLNQPFISPSSFSSRNILLANENNFDNFVNYLNPMNIEIEEVLYVLFLAE